MPPVQDLTREIGPNDIEVFSAEQTQAREHSQYARAKKVIPGPLFVPQHATQARTVDPTQVALTAASAEMLLTRKKAYRLVSSQAAYYRMSFGASAAVTGDIYLPADTPTIILPGETYDRVSVIKVAVDGIAQVVEVK